MNHQTHHQPDPLDADVIAATVELAATGWADPRPTRPAVDVDAVLAALDPRRAAAELAAILDRLAVEEAGR